MAATMASSNPGVLRVAGAVLRAAAALAAVMLLAGCLGGGTSGTSGTSGSGTPGAPGTPGTGDSSGNGYGGQGGSADGGGTGGDGGDGYGGWGSNGYGGDGSSANGDAGSVVGSGRLTSRLIGLSGVSSVTVGAGFAVRLNIGGSEQAKITMDDNLVDRVQATVTGGQLSLGLAPGVGVRNATMIAEVTVGRLDRLATSGASRVLLVSTPAGPALNLAAAGNSEVTGPIQVDRLQATASGATTLVLSGLAREADLSGTGASRLLLADLAVRNLDVNLSGTSHATVTVSDTLAADTAGASVLRYRGTPNITRQQTSGISSVAQDSP
ncbi:MAG TPA: head GIN domain-containing protein [Pseudonocardiaceae bacterium]|nr:head GIN domain-containing protein [Pseudonocardiaceae bacterium]